MPDRPILPWNPSDYIGDTMHLSTLEHGAYMLLLWAAWQSPDCGIPKDENRLRAMARCTQRQWNKVRETVLAFWHDHPSIDGKLTQKRLFLTFESVQLKSRVAQQNADARWLKNKNRPNADASNPHMQMACETDATLNPSLNLNQQTNKQKPRAKRASVPDGFEEWWKEYPLKKGKQAAAKAYAKALKTTSRETLTAGLEAFKLSEPWRGDLNFCPHAATWLNRGSWEDEYDMVNGDGSLRPPSNLKTLDERMAWVERNLNDGE